MIITASLTTGIACVARGMSGGVDLVDRILSLDHLAWETTLAIGDVEYRTTKHGPFPNHQMRVSVRPAVGHAALNYMDHDDVEMPIANSFNPAGPPLDLKLIFNGGTGVTFPRTAAIAVTDARRALVEWLQTWRRPTCIEWRPYDHY